MFGRHQTEFEPLSPRERADIQAAAAREAEAEARAVLTSYLPARSFKSCPKCGSTDLIRKHKLHHVLAYAKVEYPGPDGRPQSGESLPLVGEVLLVSCACGGFERLERTLDTDPESAVIRHSLRNL